MKGHAGYIRIDLDEPAIEDTRQDTAFSAPIIPVKRQGRPRKVQHG
jgi:hypothetical protein